MDGPLRFGLVGAGSIAQAYLNVFESCEVANLVAVADNRAEAARAAAEKMKCQWFASHEELADKADCDAIIVCTPPSTHSDIAMFFLEKGISVLCEKPFSTDIESALKVCDAAQRSGASIAMASKFRYVEDIIRAKSIIASGLLGDVILVENTFAASVDMTRRWNSDPKVAGGGVLIDNGTHSVDIVRYLVGAIDELFAAEGRRVQDIEVEDTAIIFMRTRSGANAHADLSWSLNKEQDSYIRVYGSDGLINVGWKASCYRQLSSPEWVFFGGGYDKNAAFRRMVENFCNHLRKTEPLLIGPADALASVRAIQSAYEALATGHWVKVPAAVPELSAITVRAQG